MAGTSEAAIGSGPVSVLVGVERALRVGQQRLGAQHVVGEHLAGRSQPAPSRPRMTRGFPTSLSSGARCFETAGWLTYSSSAARDSDPRRAIAANARSRASSCITLVIRDEPNMYLS